LRFGASSVALCTSLWLSVFSRIGRSARSGSGLSCLNRCPRRSHLVCSHGHLVGLKAFREIHKINDNLDVLVIASGFTLCNSRHSNKLHLPLTCHSTSTTQLFIIYHHYHVIVIQPHRYLLYTTTMTHSLGTARIHSLGLVDYVMKRRLPYREKLQKHQNVKNKLRGVTP
jgi:hypothetical protein